MGAPGSSAEREGKKSEVANHTYIERGRGYAAGEEFGTAIMILALAMCHNVERPVMGMGGGESPMEQLYQLPSGSA